MKIVREVTVGQLIGAAMFLAGYLVTFGSLKADVDDLMKIDHDKYATKTELARAQDDIAAMRKDILDILKILYVTEAHRLTTGSSEAGKTIDSEEFRAWYSNRRNADSTNSGGAGRAVRQGENKAGKEGN